MSTNVNNLFDVRGGSLQAHVCEVCGDPLPKDSLTPTCADCNEERYFDETN